MVHFFNMIYTIFRTEEEGNIEFSGRKENKRGDTERAGRTIKMRSKIDSAFLQHDLRNLAHRFFFLLLIITNLLRISQFWFYFDRMILSFFWSQYDRIFTSTEFLQELNSREGKKLGVSGTDNKDERRDP